jgi:hypothetical protein
VTDQVKIYFLCRNKERARAGMAADCCKKIHEYKFACPMCAQLHAPWFEKDGFMFASMVLKLEGDPLNKELLCKFQRKRSSRSTGAVPENFRVDFFARWDPRAPTL